MPRPFSTPALIADIGGTNARFALADLDEKDSIRLTGVHTLSTEHFPTLVDAVRTYFELVRPNRSPHIAAAAVAGPIIGDQVTLTNRAWTFSVSETRRRLHLDQFEVMNDFSAIARALPHLQTQHLCPVGAQGGAAGRATTGVMAAVGPGTGLGVGVLLCRDGRMDTIASEGGHVGFAPGDPLEAEIGRRLLACYPRISYERLISGPGLRNLYQALAEIEGTQADDLTPADIAARGVTDADLPCRHAMEKFCAILGTFAGDVALMYCADRVFIAGGMVPRFLPFLKISKFRARFESKGRYTERMRHTPTDVILHEQPGLLGAAATLFPPGSMPSAKAV